MNYTALFLGFVQILSPVIQPGFVLNVHARTEVIENTDDDDSANPVDYTGWIEDEDGLKYILEDGSYAAGWLLLDQDWYFFGENNIRQTGWIQDPDSKCWYWCDPETGIMLHDAWLNDNGINYYLGPTGSWIKDSWKKEGTSWKYVLGDGTCYNNGFHKINGLWYYFGEDGIMKTGWIKDVDGKEYFMDRKDGWMHKNEWIDGKYYVDNCGVWQKTRWVQSSNGKWWLRWPDGSYPVSSFQKVNGQTYYFGSDGYMVTGWKNINSSDYYFDPASGQMLTSQYIGNRYLYEDGRAMPVTNPALSITGSPAVINKIAIVNKKYPVAASYAPGEDPTAKAALLQLITDMQNLGYNISNQYSGFRSYEYQSRLYNNYVLANGQAKADTFSARPGYSEHQTGLAFDLKHYDGSLVTGKAEASWIAAHAHEYGFIVRYQEGWESITGYMAEPWHLRYIGEEAADIYESGLPLETYLGVMGGGYQ